MNYWRIFGFLIFPYIALTIMVTGHLYRYARDPYRWNARSSEMLEKRNLKYGSHLFHYGIILALLGHVAGLLVPQAVWSFVGIPPAVHMLLATAAGIVFGWAALAGLLILIARRIADQRVRATSTANDFIVQFILLVVIALGTYNVTFIHDETVLTTVAPWLRSIIAFQPAPDLMAAVHPSYKAHVVAAFILFAYYPFSRLVHIASAPVAYAWRTYILLRKRVS